MTKAVPHCVVRPIANAGRPALLGLVSGLSDSIIGHYERHAASWDADRRNSGWNDKPWHDRFIEELPEGGTVLDLGCGGGSPVALNLVERGLHVTGVDSSPTLISLCRRRMPEEVWIAGDMRSASLGRRFDGVLAWDSFFHLSPDDQRGMFKVFAQHAAASAALMFNTGPAYGEAIGSYRGDPLYHASLDSCEYRTLLAQSGFEVVSHAVEDRRAGRRTVWLALAAHRRINFEGSEDFPAGPSRRWRRLGFSDRKPENQWL
jgi:SAM-dependent methyltransferase